MEGKTVECAKVVISTAKERRVSISAMKGGMVTKINLCMKNLENMVVIGTNKVVGIRDRMIVLSVTKLGIMQESVLKKGVSAVEVTKKEMTEVVLGLLNKTGDHM